MLDGSWMSEGSCRGKDPEIFFPGRNEPDNVRAAKEVCSTCPVKAPCLEWAIYFNERDGVWGGTSGKQRREMRRAMPDDYRPFLCDYCGKEFLGHCRERMCSDDCRTEGRKASRRRSMSRKSFVA